jgi:autotransporter family porin
LTVSGNGTLYDGTNINLNSGGVGYGAFLYDYGSLSLTGGVINASLYGVYIHLDSHATLTMNDVDVNINGTGAWANGIVIGDTSSGTLNNVHIVATGTSVYGVATASASTLTMTGGTITNSSLNGRGINFNGTGTVSGVSIEMTGNGGHGVYLGSVSGYSILTLTDSNISATGDGAYALYVTNGNSSATVNLQSGNTITGDIFVGTSGTLTLTLTGAGTALHGNLVQNGRIILTLSDGALLDGGGTVRNLTLNDGAILGYTDGLTVTTSITLSGGITIDFSNLTEAGEYTVLDWSGASGSVNAENFTATGLDDSLQGSFSVANNQLTFNATAVPEPTTWLLLGAGLGALALIRRRC